MQVNTQNRVGQADAQLPDAVKREGVVVNRSSPDILMVVGLYSPKSTYDAVFLGNYLRHQPDGCHQARARCWRREEFHGAGLLDADLAPAGQACVAGASPPDDIRKAVQEQNAQSPAGRIGAEPAPPGQEMHSHVRALGLLKDPKSLKTSLSDPIRWLAGQSQGRGPRGTRARQTYDLRGRFNEAGGNSQRRRPSASSSRRAPTPLIRRITCGRFSRARRLGFRRTWLTTW